MALVLVSLPSLAQPGRGGRARLSPEDAKAAWAVQAGHAASKLELSEENAAKLAEAYDAARSKG